MPRITIETEHGFDFFIDFETADGKSRSVILNKQDGDWYVACYADEKLHHWVAAARTGYPEAIRRTLHYLIDYLK